MVQRQGEGNCPKKQKKETKKWDTIGKKKKNPKRLIWDTPHSINRSS